VTPLQVADLSAEVTTSREEVIYLLEEFLRQIVPTSVEMTTEDRIAGVRSSLGIYVEREKREVLKEWAKLANLEELFTGLINYESWQFKTRRSIVRDEQIGEDVAHVVRMTIEKCLEPIEARLAAIERSIDRLSDSTHCPPGRDPRGHPIRFETKREYDAAVVHLFSLGFDIVPIGFNYMYVDTDQEKALRETKYSFQRVPQQEVLRLFSQEQEEYRKEYVDEIRRDWKTQIQVLREQRRK